MKRLPSDQHEWENAFGRACARLRHEMQLTQQELATLLTLSLRTIQQWERGLSFPTRTHLIQLLALALQQQAFPQGMEYQEAKQLWLASHQPTDFDSSWMQVQLSTPRPLMVLKQETPTAHEPLIPQDSPSTPTHIDWGEAIDSRNFYGRSSQLCQLEHWILQERCRLVCLLGMGGIGKSALAVTLMYQIAPSFQSIIFRSVRNAPPCQELLADCLQVLSPQLLPTLSTGIKQHISLLLQCFQTQRCLLILDNLEALLQEHDPAGHYRPGYEDYALLLRQVAETSHQSCLLVTGRDTPTELNQWESHLAGVRVLHLIGLEQDACEHLFSEHHLLGIPDERRRLAQLYAGNPLALKIVSEVISDLFGGEIAPFLTQNTAIFSSIRDLLTEQFSRLSATEHTLLIWLAIARDPLTSIDLHALLVPPISEASLAEALLALQRRSLVEQGTLYSTFTLQSVVLEYVTDVLVEQVSQQILQGNLIPFTCYALEQARSKEYVRQAQEHMIVTPILTHLQTLYRQTNMLEKQLLHLLDQLRGWPPEAQGYGPTNLIMLLRALRRHLRGIDLSRLAIQGAYFQQVEMQDTTLAGALVQDCSFTETLDVTWCVAISSHGRYWAAGNRRGEIRVWEQEGQTLHLIWQAHTDTTYALAFSPDERILASTSWDRTVKLWDLETGNLLWTAWHTDSCNCLAFTPDGHTLASSGDDAVIRLWETASGTPIQAQTISTSAVYSLIWSPDGKLLTSCCKDGSLHLWQFQPPGSLRYTKTLTGHTDLVPCLAIPPTAPTLSVAVGMARSNSGISPVDGCASSRLDAGKSYAP